ncbi:MAG: hypothetical protein KDI13_06845 [Alphaproteobacteria bacterium]|nr:hypothetical protein [Alphaproteobacteria bacterium]
MLNNKPQSGNVLFLILIAVALFAALSYAATSSMRGGGSDVTSENNLIKSSTMSQYAASIRTAITRLTVNNRCEITELSFEAPPFDGSDSNYVNPSSPADLSCHIFAPNGGAVSRLPAPQDTNDGRDWAYIEARVLQVGTDQTACGIDCNEILLILGGLRKSICEKINDKILGTTSIVQQDDGANYENKKFIGSFTTGADFDGAGVNGEYELCTQDANGVYYYYNVLVAR